MHGFAPWSDECGGGVTALVLYTPVDVKPDGDDCLASIGGLGTT